MITRLKNSDLAKLLISHNIFYFGRSFLDIFLNILIWNDSGDIRLVALFNIAYLFVHTLSFFIFGGIVKKYNNVLIKNIGLIGFAFTIVLLAIFTEFFLEKTYLLGALIGFFNGMYWINYHVVKFDLTNKSVRAKYSGWESSLKIVSGLIAPVVGGAMLAFLPGDIGQDLLFGITIVMFLVAVFYGNFKSEKNVETERVEYIDTAKLIVKDKQVSKAIISSTFGGFVRRGAFFGTLIPLFIFSSVENEFELGNILSVISLVAALSYVIIGKNIKFAYYKKSLIFGVLIQIIGIAAILISPSIFTFIAYSIVNTMSLPFTEIPRKVITINLVHKLPDYKNQRVEFIAISELLNIVFGWMPSYMMLLLFTDLNDPLIITILLSIMIVFIVVEVLLLTSIPKEDYSE